MLRLKRPLSAFIAVICSFHMKMQDVDQCNHYRSTILFSSDKLAKTQYFFFFEGFKKIAGLPAKKSGGATAGGQTTIM